MTKRLPLLIAVLLATVLVKTGYSQNDDAARLEGLIQTESDTTGWIIGGGIGLDLGQILVINPRAGAGQNRFGIGGAIGYYANYKQDRITWYNNLSLNLSVEKLGSGVLPDSTGGPSKTKVPFRKSIDELRFNSTFGYTVKEGSKWSYSANFGLRSQLLPSYQGDEDGQIYVSEITEDGPYRNSLVSKFFSPARMALGLGMLYTPNDHFNLLITPLTADVIFVSDQDIANLGIHGNKLEDGSDTEYKTTRFALGAAVRAQYQNKWWEDRISFKTSLSLFSDYLANPQNIDVLWTNELAIDIFKGLQLSFQNNLFYDDDVLSNVTDFDDVGGLKRDDLGEPILRPAVNYFHQVLLKYVWVF